MNDLRATFLRELVDFIRSKLNAHIAKGGGLSEFVNGYLRIPCNEDQERRERAAQSLESRREYLEEVIGLDAGRSPDVQQHQPVRDRVFRA